MAEPYYHSLIRKYVVLFGSIFQDIYIDRVDSSNQTQKTLKVPLSYGPKEWYLARFADNPDLAKEIAKVLPRMAFDIQGFRYAPERKLNNTNQARVGNSYAGTLSVQNVGVPYDLMIRLSVMVRNADDGTRIIEQILPRFVPELTTSIELIPEMGITKDIPITLVNVQQDDDYQGSMKEDERVIIWNLDFSLKGWFYGPISRSGIIKHIDLSFFDTLDSTEEVSHVFIRPGLTANGEPTTSANNSIPEVEILKADNWGFIKEFTGIG